MLVTEKEPKKHLLCLSKCVQQPKFLFSLTFQIHLFNTHLSLSHVARQRTVKEIWRHMNQFSGPAFLMGDFNAEAHNKEVR